MRDEEPPMNDDAVAEAVSRYFEENPELMDITVPNPDRLWSGIEDRIQARVLPLGARPARRRWAWLPMAAAAAILIATTSSVTYVLTKRGSSAVVPTTVAAVHRDSAKTTSTGLTGSTGFDSVAVASGVDTDSPARSKIHEKSSGLRGSTRTTLASSFDTRAADPARATYDREITMLRGALDARRGQLDPSTVATIEQNLRIIDEAISQSRAALAKDPNSQLLNDQLDRTLAKKTDLLRSAALLPSA